MAMDQAAEKENHLLKYTPNFGAKDVFDSKRHSSLSFKINPVRMEQQQYNSIAPFNREATEVYEDQNFSEE